MLLYLLVMQSIALFSTHICRTKTSASVLTILFVLIITSVGGYSVHLANIPNYWTWFEYISPQRWLLPVLLTDEYSAETIANTAVQHLCRNKQVIINFYLIILAVICLYNLLKYIFIFFNFQFKVQHQEIIVQQPCPPPNGTEILADHLFLRKNHILDSNDQEMTTVIALILTSFILFVLTSFIFIFNIRRIFKKSKNSSIK